MAGHFSELVERKLTSRFFLQTLSFKIDCVTKFFYQVYTRKSDTTPLTVRNSMGRGQIEKKIMCENSHSFFFSIPSE